MILTAGAADHFSLVIANDFPDYKHGACEVGQRIFNPHALVNLAEAVPVCWLHLFSSHRPLTGIRGSLTEPSTARRKLK